MGRANIWHNIQKRSFGYVCMLICLYNWNVFYDCSHCFFFFSTFFTTFFLLIFGLARFGVWYFFQIMDLSGLFQFWDHPLLWCQIGTWLYTIIWAIMYIKYVFVVPYVPWWLWSLLHMANIMYALYNVRIVLCSPNNHCKINLP